MPFLYYKCSILTLTLHNSHRTEKSSSPYYILKIKKAWLKKFSWLRQSDTAIKPWSLDSNQGCATSKHGLLTITSALLNDLGAGPGDPVDQFNHNLLRWVLAETPQEIPVCRQAWESLPHSILSHPGYRLIKSGPEVPTCFPPQPSLAGLTPQEWSESSLTQSECLFPRPTFFRELLSRTKTSPGKEPITASSHWQQSAVTALKWKTFCQRRPTAHPSF